MADGNPCWIPTVEGRGELGTPLHPFSYSLSLTSFPQLVLAALWKILESCRLIFFLAPRFPVAPSFIAPALIPPRVTYGTSSLQVPSKAHGSPKWNAESVFRLINPKCLCEVRS